LMPEDGKATRCAKDYPVEGYAIFPSIATRYTRTGREFPLSSAA